MQWEGREESENVEDRRGVSPQAAAVGGGGLLVLVLAFVFGINPQQLAQIIPQGGGPAAVGKKDGNFKESPEDAKQAKFTKVIFGDTERIWEELFEKQIGRRYQKPTLVLFSGLVASACGKADSATGPFYCPADSKVYIDLSFYRDLERQLNAPGDFARAYVIAHEVGHHVQRLLGYSKAVDAARGTRNENQMLVRLELQADYFAGVWAHHAQQKYKFLEPGDVESALKAAFEIGDDRLQKKSRGTVMPDSFTHGTSAQRQRWFRKGLETGSVEGAKALFELRYSDL